ncbi:TVP38/TMEM64 family protein [Acidaminobacter sp. JC074]|uniref:TVP38/TMEM64 family protein n=1 Tax=Acidaminobacter sp. JC074 TaxID=2530199 RepID=UPI001F0E3EC0|nr:TVP38/TMEM64 family protein [Acidaminobacter sp. JC074]MCH4889585.1 TVP38/TMEM64 family protein [Acidaminobacter sp. JC074]
MTKKLINGLTILGMILSLLFLIYGYNQGLFTSQDKLNAFLNGFGYFSVVVFILFQAIQVVIPILPGSLGCLVGVIFYGPVYGFAYNYIGISIGSIVAFYLARRYGTSFVKSITKPKDYDKYSKWMNSLKNFDKWFALLIFSPIAPDDLLCYLAGLTRIQTKKFVTIILMFKPFSILAYSIGLDYLFGQITRLLGA